MPDQYQLEITSAARRDLKRLPAQIQKDIVFKHLPKIRNNPFSTNKPLLGFLHDERAYHFGRKPEYRRIYFIEQNFITVTIIGSREGIYKRAKRRKK